MTWSMTSRNDVSVFDNTMSRYTEYWKRAALYSMKLKLDGKQKQKAVTLVWRGMLVSLQLTLPDQLEDDGALDSLLTLLDARFKNNEATEEPEVFEECVENDSTPRTGVPMLENKSVSRMGLLTLECA